MSTANNTRSSAEVLFGGERILIRFVDANTPPQYMLIRALPLDLYPLLLKSLEDESALVSLYMDIETEEVRTLHPDSVAEALRVGDEINMRPFSESRARTDARLLRFAGEVSERREAELLPTHGQAGANSSPGSAHRRACHGAPLQATASRESPPLHPQFAYGPVNRFLMRCWQAALHMVARL